MMLWIILSGFCGVVLGFFLAACLAVSQRAEKQAEAYFVARREALEEYADADPGL